MENRVVIPTCCIKKRPLPPWAEGTVPTPAGSVLKIKTVLSCEDTWGMIKSRMSAFRMDYAIPPGLYAVGEPTNDSDIFVSANYKMSFDVLRRELHGMNAWILVLDTKGINVWCAAGKGTFGTEELIKRITEAKLDTVVAHRRIIVPQLGAVGVAAGEVQRKTGFRVWYGPVHAKDIREYVNAGYKKTEAMTRMEFPLLDRLVLTPIELNPLMKKFPWFAAVVLLIFGLHPTSILYKEAWFNGWPFLLLGFIAALSGALVTPVLLPFIPFRSFAIKGWIVGLGSVLFATHWLFHYFNMNNPLLLAISFILFPTFSSYIALQFTGSTTYTGMTGVRKELKISIPIYFGALGISLLLLIVFKIQEITKNL